MGIFNFWPLVILTDLRYLKKNAHLWFLYELNATSCEVSKLPNFEISCKQGIQSLTPSDPR